MCACFVERTESLLNRALTAHDLGAFFQDTLQQALEATGGLRAFLAGIDPATGAMHVLYAAGPGWTESARLNRLYAHNRTEGGITAHAARSGQLWVCPDVHSDPYYVEHFSDVQSEVAVPCFDTEARVCGVLNVQSQRPAAFAPRHCARLKTLAAAAALALALQEYRERERNLVEIGLQLSVTQQKGAFLQSVVGAVQRALRCEACSLFLLDEGTQQLVLRASSSSLAGKEGEVVYTPGEGLTGSVVLTGETIRLEDPRTDPRWKGRHPEFVPDAMGAFLAAPISGHRGIAGVLRASRPRTGPTWFQARFTESDEQMLRAIGAQLGAALENRSALEQQLHNERMAAWGELSARSAHMIGNRVFAIKGDLNELKYQLAESPACSEQVTVLVNGLEQGLYRLEDILREFRDFVVATRIAVSCCSINDLLAEALSETVPALCPVKVCTDFEPNLPALHLDATRLRRAFAELIENAISFQPETGWLKVASCLTGREEMESQVRLNPLQTYLKITFEDGGPGVPKDRKEQIFTPFFTSRVRGMGLGLSIVRGIVEAHYGIIAETGTAGEGARFEIYLPVPRGAQGTGAQLPGKEIKHGTDFGGR